MKIIETSFVVWYLILGVIEANIIDDIILNNWRDKGPVMKQSDPFYNPFGLPFPLFGDMAVEEPLFPDMKIADMKIPDMKIPDMKISDVKFSDGKTSKADGKSSKADGKEVAKKSVERSHKGSPWFSFSDFLSLPEISRKRNHEGHKAEVGIPDKISQTGDLKQTNNPIEGATRKSGAHEDDREHSLIISDDDNKRVDDRDWMIKNGSKAKTFVKGFGSSFPKGLSDILIIFQKVGPKTKTHSIVSSDAHTCNGYNCRNGICELKKPEAEEELPKKHSSSILEHFDRIFLLIIPIVLGIGTVFFILELRRIYRKMKKQAIVTTFEHQEC